mmetsp:Transcript_51773/g.118977  ORF Transcript_51773/g.118977 Transcript_51773/m.118977 type:complete len:320 (-) Transcript_51773:820-1779(-)
MAQILHNAAQKKPPRHRRSMLAVACALARQPRSGSSGDHNVVNLEDEADALGGEGDGARVHEQRHEHVLFENVGHPPLAHIDARRCLARRVPIAQVSHHLDSGEAGVLGERVRHNLHGLGECLDAIRVRARQSVGPLGELVRELHLRSAASRGEEALLDEAAQHAERVVERPLRLVEHKVVRSLAEDGHCLASVGHAGDLDDLALPSGHLLHEVGLAELLGVDSVGVGDGHATARLADELHVVALDILDNKYLHLCEEVQRQLVHRIAQDRLLNQQYVAPRLLDLLTEVEDVLALLLKDAIHLRVVGDDDVLFDVCLGR